LFGGTRRRKGEVLDDLSGDTRVRILPLLLHLSLDRTGVDRKSIISSAILDLDLRIDVIAVLLDNLLQKHLGVQNHSQLGPAVEFHWAELFAKLGDLLLGTEVTASSSRFAVFTAWSKSVHFTGFKDDSCGSLLVTRELGGLPHERVHEVDDVVVA
jgi:hypothetical protein